MGLLDLYTALINTIIEITACIFNNCSYITLHFFKAASHNQAPRLCVQPRLGYTDVVPRRKSMLLSVIHILYFYVQTQNDRLVTPHLWQF